jgi:hypothetical protein
MSRANAQVKFPDGTIKHGIYNGTIDVYMAYLTNSNEEAWNLWDAYKKSGYDDSLFEKRGDTEFFEVEIADDYGGGDTYRGQATKSQIVSELDTDDMEKIKDGLPEWWVS